jgi:hypothetical protein
MKQVASLISLRTSIAPGVMPIDKMQHPAAVDSSIIRKNITDQIEYVSAQIDQDPSHPHFDAIMAHALDRIVGDYVYRRYIEPDYRIEMYETFRIIPYQRGADIVWTTKSGHTLRQSFHAKTTLLSAVGRHTLRRKPGVVMFKPHFHSKAFFAPFTFCDYI